MTPVVRRGEEGERGAVLIIVTIAMVVLIGLIAIAIDGSFGFVQNRRAQNATDFAAYAAAQQLDDSTYCNGTNALTMQQVTAIVQQLIQDNDSGIGTNWSAQYLSSTGKVIPNSTFTATSSDTPEPPPGACGVTVSANPTWSPFFAGIFGIHQLAGYASGSVSNTAKGQPFSIVALNQVGPHEILGGGTGTFVVSGDIVLNTNVTNQPWSGSSQGYLWDDAIDAKTDSNLYVYGTIHTIGSLNGQMLWPLDTCFQGTGAGKGLHAGAIPGNTYQPGVPLSAQALPQRTDVLLGAGPIGHRRLRRHRRHGDADHRPPHLVRGATEPAELEHQHRLSGQPEPDGLQQHLGGAGWHAGPAAGHLPEPGRAHRLGHVRGLPRARRRVPGHLRVPGGAVDQPAIFERHGDGVQRPDRHARRPTQWPATCRARRATASSSPVVSAETVHHACRPRP